MAIFGHEVVFVVKVVERRVWEVRTRHSDPAQRQLLVEVKWEDAFKEFPHAKDYGEAVITCQSHERTALTFEEEDLVMDLLDGRITREQYEAIPKATRVDEPIADAPPPTSLEEFRRRREGK